MTVAITPAPLGLGAVDWGAVRLVAFDVDGTLYRQRPLRWRMARDLAFDAAGRRDTLPLRVLGAYRRIRERLSDNEVADFEARLIAETAAVARCPAAAVCEIVATWIDHRPLRYLNACRYPRLDVLFAALRRHRKTIGVLSDYPAHAKLAALSLAADHIVSASDPGIGRLKPHPRGLEALLAAAGSAPHEAVLIGDRAERDGAAGQRAGVRVLIRSDKRVAGWQTFARFDDPVFAPLLAV